MLSLIEVKCPHCGARGQIILPPLGALIIGPCPECKEFVMVFCGLVLPLQKDVVLNGTVEQKRDHLMTVLTGFLRERVQQIVTENMGDDDEIEAEELEHELASPKPVKFPGSAKKIRVPSKGKPISASEIDRFVHIELDLLDKTEYFKRIFG